MSCYIAVRCYSAETTREKMAKSNSFPNQLYATFAITPAPRHVGGREGGLVERWKGGKGEELFQIF